MLRILETGIVIEPCALENISDSAHGWSFYLPEKYEGTVKPDQLLEFIYDGLEEINFVQVVSVGRVTLYTTCDDCKASKTHFYATTKKINNLQLCQIAAIKDK